VNLIYIDPPFDTGADFSFTAAVPDAPDDQDAGSLAFTKEPSIIEQKAYRDTWGRGLDSYLQWFYETVTILHDLLAENGSIYVHLDWRMMHYGKVILDEVFAKECFLNEIVWAYFAFKRSTAKKFPQKHDIIISYHKSEKWIWNTQFKPHKGEYLKRWKVDADGQYYRDDVNPTKGGTRVIYLDELEGDIVDSVWDDIPPVNPVAAERQNYPTQKPEALLERIVKASSNEDDLILDCFSGSGTTAAVAEKLNRRWIACDLGRFAVHTTRKRLLNVENVRPFVVQNLGKYERQHWQTGQFAASAEPLAGAQGLLLKQQQAYIDFMLKLYHAQPLTGRTLLHGVKVEFKRAMGTGKGAPTTNGVDLLGWDFAFEVNEVARQQAERANLDLRFLRIPREVMEKKAVDQGDVKFFELAALEVAVKTKKLDAALSLTNFIIPPDDVPEEVRKAVTHWSQWIDYWAVDWNHGGDAFHNEWQSFRTRKQPKLELSVPHTYEKAGEYNVVVKVIDILGNDTTKTVKVVVK
jgi:adenine specific DNA methylase Mod